MAHSELQLWTMYTLLFLALITRSQALSLIMSNTVYLQKRSSSNPVGWRGEWFIVSVSESSAPPMTRPEDFYKSEDQPSWLAFHSTNRSWTGWVPTEGPDDEKLQFRIIGNVQNQEILQSVNIVLMKRPQRSLPSTGTSLRLSPDFLIPISLPLKQMMPNAPSILSKQLSPVFLPRVNVIDTQLADMAKIPVSDMSMEVTEIFSSYERYVTWTTPSKNVQWRLNSNSMPSWLEYDAESGKLSGTVPKASLMIEARDFKRGAVQVLFTADPSPVDTNGPKPTQVIVIRPKSENARPEFDGQDNNKDGPISTRSAQSGSSLEWNLAQPIRDTDGDLVTWMCTQSALGLPPWARFDARTGTMRGTVPSGSNATSNNAMLIDWSNVSLPLRGSMPEGKLWSSSSSFWVTAMDPLGGLADWKRADLLVDDKRPPIPLRPLLDIPRSTNATSTISVHLSELFDTPIKSVFDWQGFVGVLPADQPITLDERGALIVDPLGRNREVLAHIILVNRDGATGVATVSFPKQAQSENSGPARTDQSREMESETSSLGTQVILGIVLCLVIAFAVAIWLASRKRRMRRNRDILNQIRKMGRRQPSPCASIDSGSITMIPTEPANSAEFYQDADPLKLPYYKHKLEYADDLKSSHFSTLDSVQVCHESFVMQVNDTLNKLSLSRQDSVHSQSFELSTSQHALGNQKEYPSSISTPNPPGFTKSLSVIPESDISDSLIASSAAPEYSNKFGSNRSNNIKQSIPRTHIADTSMSIEPPSDMPHVDAVSGEPFSYLHPNVWQDYQANSNRLGVVRYGLVSGHFRKQVPRWICIDPTTGGIAGIPTENEVDMATVLAIVRWEVTSNDIYPEPDIPIDAIEIARFYVNVLSSTTVFANRDTVIDHDVQRPKTPPPPLPFPTMSAVSELVSKFNIKTSIHQSSSSRTTEIMHSTPTDVYMETAQEHEMPSTDLLRKLLLETNMPKIETQLLPNTTAEKEISSLTPSTHQLRRRSSFSAGFATAKYMQSQHSICQQKRRSSFDTYQQTSHTSTEAIDRQHFEAWLRNSVARNTMDFELNCV